MYSFLISLVALILGYFIYGSVVDRIFGPDPAAVTPAVSKNDGVDYVPMPTWKVFMVQFLNIAGTGPIFGAIMGAKFGPSCFLWIVGGSIFAGAVHDYMTGMLSMRCGGASLPEIVGKYSHKSMKSLMLGFSLLLLLLVGTVFVYSPALILGDIASLSGNRETSIMFWVGIIFLYYIVATLLPVDKIIGRFYPIFAFALLFMAAALGVCLLMKWPSIPEFWDGLQNRTPMLGIKGQDIFPALFITVACGAISGFHSTQSPIMARCLKNEKMGRPVFFGAMITEGIVALIWAAVASYFFFDGGMEEVGATSAQAPVVVTSVAKSWLGLFGGVLAILGVVAAPITSGDTAFRSARLILADFIGMDQKKKINRLILGIPIFLIASLLLWFNIADENGFNVIWRYFGWANQMLATLSLWIVTFFLMKERSGVKFLISAVPAVFMGCVVVTYICIDNIGLGLDSRWIPLIVGICAVSSSIYMAYKYYKVRKAK